MCLESSKCGFVENAEMLICFSFKFDDSGGLGWPGTRPAKLHNFVLIKCSTDIYTVEFVMNTKCIARTLLRVGCQKIGFSKNRLLPAKLHKAQSWNLQLIYPPNVETSRLLKSTPNLNLRSFQNFCAEITEKLWSFKIIAGDPKRVILSGH